MSKRLMVLDTETTGTWPRRDRVVELAVLLVGPNLAPEEHRVQRFNPGMPIPPAATAIHGIRDEHVKDCPPFKSVAPWLQGLVDDGVPILAYKVTFDVMIVHHELKRAKLKGVPWDHPTADAYEIFREHVPHTLSGAVRHYLGRTHMQAHGAEPDARATLDVFRVQAERNGWLGKSVPWEPALVPWADRTGAGGLWRGA